VAKKFHRHGLTFFPIQSIVSDVQTSIHSSLWHESSTRTRPTANSLLRVARKTHDGLSVNFQGQDNMSQFENKIRKNLVSFVRFTKKDGTIRNMICTVHPIMIPKDKHPNGYGSDYTTEQVRVFDIVAQEWRSMLAKNILEVEEYGAVVAEVA
jgi:hypothetical protein